MQPSEDAALGELIRRLIVDRDLRARFRRDPGGVCEEFGLVEIAEELAAGGNALETLELRESRSPVAGALIAAASEGMAALHPGGSGFDVHASTAGDPHSSSGGGAVGDAPDQLDLDESIRQLTDVHYGFVRDSQGSGIDYHKLLTAGYNGVLFSADDKNLGEAVAAARAAGIPDVGIWAPANGEDPDAFAQRLAALSEYKPSIVVPDVEVEGKGLPGSPQWQWSEEFANAYRKLAPHQLWGVTVTPLQDDFNYGAYLKRGASIWPQTYGATYDTTYDPATVIKRLVANGVDPRVINPVLAPNQPGTGLGHYASYALDDFGGNYPSFTPGAAVEPIDTAPPPTPQPTPPPPDPHTPAPAKPAASAPAAPAESPPPGEDEASERLPREADVAAPRGPRTSDSGVFDVLRPGGEPTAPRPHSTVQLQHAVDPAAGHGAHGDAAAVDAPGGGSSAGGVLPDANDAYPGDDAPPEEIAAWMARQAHKAGLPGELPVMAALVESHLHNYKFGDLDSLGFFQMRKSVWEATYPNYEDHPELQLRWFIDHALAVRQKRVAAGDGTFGLDDGSWGGWIAAVEQPAKQYEYRYQLQLGEARRLLELPGAGRVHHEALEDVVVVEPGAAAARGGAAVELAQRYLGVRYTWGGERPETGFDCSGFTQYVYGRLGVDLPRVAAAQFEAGIPVDRAQLVAGDLVFFRDAHGHIHHMGMYVGEGRFIHAPHTGDVVKVSSLDEPYYAQQFAGGRRVAGLGEGPIETPPAHHDAAATGESGVFAALGKRQPVAPPHSTVQFLPAVEREEEPPAGGA